MSKRRIRRFILISSYSSLARVNSEREKMIQHRSETLLVPAEFWPLFLFQLHLLPLVTCFKASNFDSSGSALSLNLDIFPLNEGQLMNWSSHFLCCPCISRVRSAWIPLGLLGRKVIERLVPELSCTFSRMIVKVFWKTYFYTCFLKAMHMTPPSPSPSFSTGILTATHLRTHAHMHFN